MTPQISVCIPVYNGGGFIGEAITSVIGQTFTDFELLVVDNASTDDTVEIVRQFDDPRIRLIEEKEHLPAVGNWNRATAMCSGRYLKLLCADDALAPTCLERQFAALESHPQACLAAGLRDIVDENGTSLIRARGLAGMNGFVPGHDVIALSVRRGTNVLGEPASVLMRAQTVRAAGLWSGDLPYMIDLEFYFRLLQYGGVFAIQEPLAKFRVHASSWSASVGRHQASQSIQLFRRWQRQPGSRIRARDALIGGCCAHALALGRRLAYTRTVHVMRNRRSSAGSDRVR